MNNWNVKDEIQEKYLEVCKKAVENDNFFKNFKSDKDYRKILEHVDYGLGMRYLEMIKVRFPRVLKDMILFKQNDLLGKPEMIRYSEIGLVSPTTLRYIYVAMDIFDKTGKDIKECGNIVEIGGGYGGQAKILHDIASIEGYYIHDIKDVQRLQRKYLKKLGVNLLEEQPESIDIVVSNYAWSELSEELREFYCKNVISKSDSGYITINPGSEENRDKMISQLKRHVKYLSYTSDIDYKRKNNAIVFFKNNE